MRLWVISLTARESLTCLLWSWWKTCNPQVIISNQQTLPGGLSKWINLYLLFSWAAVKLSISEAPVCRDHIMWAHKLELPTGKNIPDKQIPLISQRGFFGRIWCLPAGVIYCRWESKQSTVIASGHDWVQYLKSLSKSHEKKPAEKWPVKRYIVVFHTFLNCFLIFQDLIWKLWLLLGRLHVQMWNLNLNKHLHLNFGRFRSTGLIEEKYQK